MKRNSKGQFIKGNIPWHTGKNWNEEAKEKMRNSAKNRKKENAGVFTKGHSATQRVRDKISETKRRNGLSRGKNNPAWKGGTTALSLTIRHLPECDQWRSDVFQRDNWTCQTCHKRGGYLEAHHSIYFFSEIIKHYKITTLEQAIMCEQLWDRDNGVTLCKDCHKLTDDYLIKGRKAWEKN